MRNFHTNYLFHFCFSVKMWFKLVTVVILLAIVSNGNARPRDPGKPYKINVNIFLPYLI
jgi:hypothetical protein